MRFEHTQSKKQTRVDRAEPDSNEMPSSYLDKRNTYRMDSPVPNCTKEQIEGGKPMKLATW